MWFLALLAVMYLGITTVLLMAFSVVRLTRAQHVVHEANASDTCLVTYALALLLLCFGTEMSFWRGLLSGMLVGAISILAMGVVAYSNLRRQKTDVDRVLQALRSNANHADKT